MKAFNEYLDQIVKILGNRSTFLYELKNLCIELFGTKFHGVYTADNLPHLTKKVPYAIINLDKTGEPGSHWVATALYKKDNLLMYDSFGRKTPDIIPEVAEKYNYVDTDYDPEQDEKEYNCGQRCIAWLLVFDNYGYGIAKLI